MIYGASLHTVQVHTGSSSRPQYHNRYEHYNFCSLYLMSDTIRRVPVLHHARVLVLAWATTCLGAVLYNPFLRVCSETYREERACVCKACYATTRYEYKQGRYKYLKSHSLRWKPTILFVLLAGVGDTLTKTPVLVLYHQHRLVSLP